MITKSHDSIENMSNIQEYYMKNKLGKLHDVIGSVFEHYFIDKGYEQHRSAPLISQEDKTIAFTGSSTSVVKPIIVSGDYTDANGFIITQACLRNHALKHAYTNSWLPFGQAYFNMSTILSKPGRFREVIEEATEFTTSSLSIDPSRIFIKSTMMLDKLKKTHEYTALNVEYDSMEKSCYHWRYGIPKMHGEGLTISIKGSSGEPSLDVGNIVRFLDDKNNERGIEFGYGHEFLLSTILGVENPLALSEVFEIFPFKPDISSKYYGYLEAIVRIKKAKEDIKLNSSARGTYNKYIKAIDHLRVPLGKSKETMFSDLSKFCDHVSAPTDFTLEKKLLTKRSQ